MKKRYLPFLFISAIAITSCTLFFGDSSYSKRINVYDIDRLDETNTLSSGFQKTLDVRFMEGQDLIPYITLSQYASLYDKHLQEGAKSEVSESSYASSWTISKDNQYCFAVLVSYYTGEITVAGSIDAVYKEDDDPRDLRALNYGLDVSSEGSTILSGTGYATYSFYEYDIDYIRSGGKSYLPLSLFDITFSDTTSIYFTYNYKHILSTRDVENYSTKRYIDDGQEYTFDSQMVSSVYGLSLPNYLRDYNASLFLYLMDHFYGLKNEKGISSFETYYKSKGFYNGLFNYNGAARGQAYSDALSLLDDGHTVLVSVNPCWGESFSQRRKYSTNMNERSKLAETLKDYRSATYASYNNSKAGKDILYSQDGKTALFSFDSFEFGSTSQVFNDDDSVKETAKNYDTFFRILDVINTIKNRGGVENIVLDISVNGGGVIGVMLKLLALISKNNNGYVAMYQDTTTQLGIYNSKIDINNDKTYDLDDCFGDEFNFYILTSGYSYSCANAFPCSAQVKGVAKIIGQQSGGGECAVAIHYLPNSEYVYHSSNLHIGYYDETNKEFKGYESGATPDIEIPVNENFYSIESINAAIQNA